jgi:hypothetical protein
MLTAMLNCNTDALIKSFQFIPENGKLAFLIAVENDTQDCLVARGRVTVMNWIGDGDMQDPVTIESELAKIAELERLVETKVIDSVEQSGGRVIFTFGDGSTFETDDLTGPPGPPSPSDDEVIEFPSLSAFPATGEAGKIYIALDTNYAYRWGTSVYVQIGGGSAQVPIAPSTADSASGKPADAKATGDALAGKQATISDLATIRSGATAGASAYQKPVDGIPATDMATSVQTSLGKADTALQTAPVQSVNGKTGSVKLTGADIKASQDSTDTIFDVLVSLALNQRYAAGETITASGQLADRTGNRVVPLADNTADIVLTFPGAETNYLRDFEILVTNTVGNTGNITFTPPTGATVYGDGFSHSPASGETWLYVVSEAAANVFWCKSEKMEVAQ